MSSDLMTEEGGGRQRAAAPVLSLALLLATACGGGGAREPTPAPAPEWAEVQAVLQARCSSCHGAAEAAAGLRVDDWNALMAGSDHGEAIIPFDPARSLAVELAAELRHPADVDNNTPLTADELDTLRRWIAGGARSALGEVAYAESRDLVYVTNQGADVVSVIDASAGVVARTVDLAERGYGPNAKPHHVAVEPSGDHWFVTLIGGNRVLEFDRSNRILGTAPFETPGMLAVHPTEDRLYVGRSMSAVNPPQRIGVIRPSDMTIEEVDVFFPRPHPLGIAPGGAHVYTGSMSVNQVAAVAGVDEVELTSVPGPAYSFMHFDVSPDGTTMVATTHTGELLLFSLADPMRPELTGSIRLGRMPWTPVYTPDGRYVFVGNKEDDTVSVVDMTIRQVVKTLRHPGIAQPHGAAVSRDGTRVFVSNNNTDGSYTARYPLEGSPPGTVVVIDVTTLEVIKVLEVEQNPTGVGARRSY